MLLNIFQYLRMQSLNFLISIVQQLVLASNCYICQRDPKLQIKSLVVTSGPTLNHKHHPSPNKRKRKKENNQMFKLYKFQMLLFTIEVISKVYLQMFSTFRCSTFRCMMEDKIIQPISWMANHLVSIDSNFF